MFSESKLYLCIALTLAFLILTNTNNMFANVYVGIESIAPAGVQQTKEYDITVQLTNYSTALKLYFEIEWTVSEQYDNVNASLDNKFISTDIISIDDYSVSNVKIGSYTFEQGKTYLIIAKISKIYEIVPGLPIGNDSGFDTFYQVVNAPYTDIGAFTIDSPSPKGSNTADGLYATFVNYGNNKLYSTYVKYIRQDTSQSDVITPVDTLQSDWVPKYTSWTREFFVFNPPIDSGAYIQIKVDKDNTPSDVIIVSSWKPNGQSDAAGDDTCRAFFGENLLGKYSISNNSAFKAQFGSINEAISYLYSAGIYTDAKESAITGFGGGVQFYTRPGTYKGSMKFDGIPSNGSVKNTVTFTSYSSDSTSTVVDGDSGSKYALLLNNMQFMAIKWLTFNAGGDGNVVQMTGTSKNFVISSSVLNAQATTSQDASQSVIYSNENLDSCSILNCTIENGSYGVYYDGSSDQMNTVGVSHCMFYNQTNAAISMSNQAYPFIVHNIIYNNRAEVINSQAPIATNNRIYIDSDISSINGQGYQSSDTKSALALISCTDELIIVGNNLCVKNTNAYGLHLKDCSNSTSTQSVLNNNSFQSDISAIYMQNVGNLFFSKISANMTGGKTNSQAGLYIDKSCSNLGMARNAFNNSGGGYALILETKSPLTTTIRDNFYSTGGAFVNILDHGEFSTTADFQTYMGFDTHQPMSNLDPQFYEDCDLIACNSQVKNGYQECNQTDAPNHFQPADNSQNHPLDVQFFWGVHDTSFSYWLQVSTQPDFGGIVHKDEDDVQAFNDLVYNLPDIDEPYRIVYGLNPNTKYYWRVRVCGNDSRSSWSNSTSFTTGTGVVSIEDENIDKVLSYTNIHIYPNPSNDYIEISISNKGLQPFAAIDNVKIFNMLGIEVMTESIHPMTTSYRMNIKILSAGIYYIKIGEKVEKFVKM